MTIIPMRDLKDTAAVERKCQAVQGPIFVTKNGYGSLVVMDIRYYERTMRKIHEAKLIAEGLADLAEGRTEDGESVRRKMTEKYGL